MLIADAHPLLSDFVIPGELNWFRQFQDHRATQNDERLVFVVVKVKAALKSRFQFQQLHAILGVVFKPRFAAPHLFDDVRVFQKRG